jgi:chromosome condensin MukBEF complex kleisin-like MukF subunit
MSTQRTCLVGIDDLLINSSSLSKHRLHIQQVLQRLRKFRLQADIGKSEFHFQKVKYLNLFIKVTKIWIELQQNFCCYKLATVVGHNQKGYY